MEIEKKKIYEKTKLHSLQKITVKKVETTVGYAILTACFTYFVFLETQWWIFVSLAVNTSQYSVFFVYNGKNFQALIQHWWAFWNISLLILFWWTISVALHGMDKTLEVTFKPHVWIWRQQCFLAMACHKTKGVRKFCSQNLNSNLILPIPFTKSS